MNRNQPSRRLIGFDFTPARVLAAVPALAFALLVVGCHQDKDIPAMKTQVVEAYGQTLDESASPQQVAYVLIRSLHDDVQAAQAHDHDAQEQAFETTFSLAAFSEIDKRLEKAFGAVGGEEGKGKGPNSVRAGKIHEVIYHWAPVVAHYVRSFDTDYEAAVAKMKSKSNKDESVARVLYPVAHDPTQTDPDLRQDAMLDIGLVKEKATDGEQMFWRVTRIAYVGPGVLSAGKSATKPTATKTAP